MINICTYFVLLICLMCSELPAMTTLSGFSAAQNSDISFFPSSVEGAPDYIKNHPFVQSLQADLRRASNQVIKSAESHCQLVEENARLKVEVHVLDSKVQGLHAELQSVRVNSALQVQPTFFSNFTA
jgi:hypothetical protein